jgi:hypothetical protein
VVELCPSGFIKVVPGLPAYLEPQRLELLKSAWFMTGAEQDATGQ